LSRCWVRAVAADGQQIFVERKQLYKNSFGLAVANGLVWIRAFGFGRAAFLVL
jgi:hypothetical protein